MSLTNWNLGETPLRLFEDTPLLKTERCLVTLKRGALALPLLFGGEIRGYAFKVS